MLKVKKVKKVKKMEKKWKKKWKKWIKKWRKKKKKSEKREKREKSRKRKKGGDLKCRKQNLENCPWPVVTLIYDTQNHPPPTLSQNSFFPSNRAVLSYGLQKKNINFSKTRLLSAVFDGMRSRAKCSIFRVNEYDIEQQVWDFWQNVRIFKQNA